MKLPVISLIVFAIPINLSANELSDTTKYFAQDSNKQHFIMSEDKICYGPDSESRLTIPLSFGDNTINNIFADLKACTAAGGAAPEVETAAKTEPLIIGNCELNPKNRKEFKVSSGDEAVTKDLEYEKSVLAARIHCLTSKDEITEDDEKLRSSLIVELAKLNDPTSDEEEQVSEGRIISSFEFGTMKLPNYEDGNNGGLSGNKEYFDVKIDGRFHFSDLGLLVNTNFNASLYGAGVYSKETEEDIPPTDPAIVGRTSLVNSTINTTEALDFNDVSDTLDANFTMRIAADACYSEKDEKDKEKYKYPWYVVGLSCLSSSDDRMSSLGLTLSYGFINKEKRLADEDTVNDYRAIGLEYRHYRNPIQGNTNRIPDFVVSYQRAKFEEYGVEQYTDGCPTDSCERPIENVYRYLVNLNYRLLDDKPFFLGLRLNAGPGPDDYGITLGIRKSGKSVLDIFGIN
jgi:hypothetical protein